MKKSCLLIFFIILLAGCSEDVTKDYLIGGHWVGTAGYEDEEIGGEPYCSPFDKGMEFKDEDTVYIDAYERDFEYKLEESDNGLVIEFYDPDKSLLSYYLTKISEDEMGFIGVGDFQDGESCYLERK
ncbi:hypothetical protein F3157_10215 [Virgibacillus dakarensis]|uniref:hypothetical protein n=1 Tax=Virgibacillus dakarensis TaxID=1917889 RepID=UPI000B43BF43|nr:hypothetical protein [Virgibacillus dakarensis]MBT2215536.1 hypothetical protein [Virgibacillus dakarensis]MTW86029.1 hypothetical protein [Virgibacillus dakarensis]